MLRSHARFSWVSALVWGLLAVDLLLRSASAFAATTQSPAHGLWLPFYEGTVPKPPGVMLQYSPSQLLELNNHGLPSDIGVIEQLGLLRRSRYVHRGSCRGFVYTGTGSSIPSLWSESRSMTVRLRHPNTVTMETENPAKPRTRRNGDSCPIHIHILENETDIICLTETWLKLEAFSVLNESCPPRIYLL
ncbi:hypothetical protein Q8A73_001802 [Channa argus]|nr:hypothetical protein Q8A73_001802 [Channa argus]